MRNEESMQEHLFEHFKSEVHSGFLGNVPIKLTDKADGKDSKRRENYWMRTLKTYTPFRFMIMSDQSHAEVQGLNLETKIASQKKKRA